MTAHEKFKNREPLRLAISFGVTVLAAALLMFLPPNLSTVQLGPQHTARAMKLIEIQPPSKQSVIQIQIPEEPNIITKPAQPVLPDVDIDLEISIPKTTFEEYTIEKIDPPIPESDEEERIYRHFSTESVFPYLKNQRRIVRILQRKYPIYLQRAGLGGTVHLDLLVDVDGRVISVAVRESSGRQALDDIAMEVAYQFLFSPAIQRGEKTRIWVHVPIRFVPH